MGVIKLPKEMAERWANKLNPGVVMYSEEDGFDEDALYRKAFKIPPPIPGDPQPAIGNPNAPKKILRGISESIDNPEEQEEIVEERVSPKKMVTKYDTIIIEDPDIDTDITDETAVIDPIPDLKGNGPSQKGEKVRLTTDISKELHTRLKIHAIRTGRSHIQIIEGWIEAYCP